MIGFFKKYTDLKLILIIVIVQLTLNLYDVFQRSFITKKGVLNLNYDLQGEEIFGKLAEFTGVIIYMVIVSVIVNFFIKKRTSIWIVSTFHLIIPITLPQFTWTIYHIPEIIREKSLKSLEFTDFYISRYVLHIRYYYTLYFLILGIIYLYFYFKKIQENKIQTARLQAQLSDTKLKFLQSQIHPHFLFNTLNSVYSLMDIDASKSKDMVISLSDLLRTVLDKKDQNLIEFQEELFILKKYIHINEMRFSDNLKFHINIETGLDNILIPNMLIQPIIENAIKHGYSEEHVTLDVFVNIYKKLDALFIIIENNGEKLDSNLSSLLKKGHGLSNIKDRLQTLYEENHQFEMFNKNNHVVTSITFPVQLSISKIENDI
ncbi:histidine kinase [Flavivirga abyssicola]|uniref:sensor histidine kinase n=1 Tax=Flavivirga abyssicola TaxID=3063533 RepID=UPI0026E05504|nr:histidine kinase [Flavivirga sp. MEBiC07777]WVK14281.1 histidine kinase [Flavivirga sp. MEBiC07777]